MIINSFNRSKKFFFIFLLCIFLFIFSFKVFTLSINNYPTTDSLPINLTAFNILFNKRLDLNNFKNILIKKDLIGITTLNKENNKIYSKVPVIVGILNVPAFFLINKYFSINYLTEKVLVENPYTQFVGKIASSIYTSLSVVFLFLSLYYLNRNWQKTILPILIYIFSTNVFNTASQANWQHGISLMFINLSIFIYIFIIEYKKAHSKKIIFILGFLLSLLTQIRISNGFYLFFFIYLFLKNKNLGISKIIKLIAFYLLNYIFFILLNKLNYFPYGYSNEIIFSLKEITPFIFLKNLISVLFSPNYGIFFFSPILLTTFFCFLNKKLLNISIIKSSILTIFVFIFFVSFWWMWTGGKSLNARLLSEANPLFIIIIYYVYHTFKNKNYFKLIFVSFFILSFYINLLTTVFLDISYYDKYPFKPGHKNQFVNAWYIRPPLLLYLAKRNTIEIKKMYKRNNIIYLRTLVYRPSLKYKGIIKLFEGEEKLIKINR